MTDSDPLPFTINDDQKNKILYLAKENAEHARVWADGFRALDMADDTIRNTTQGKKGILDAQNDREPTNTAENKKDILWTIINPDPVSDYEDGITKVEIYPYYCPSLALKLYHEQLNEHRVRPKIPTADSVLKIYKRQEIIIRG